MRILLLSDRIPPENKGGAEMMAWRLALGLRDAGHEVHVIATTAAAPFEEQREGITTYHLHSSYRERFFAYVSLYNPQTVPHLSALYKRIHPDIIHAHNVHGHLSYHSLTIAHHMGYRVVLSSHDVMPFAYGKLTHFIDPASCDVDLPDAYRLPPFYNLRQMRLRYNPLRNVMIRHVLTQHVDERIVPSEALRQAHAVNYLPPFRVVSYGINVKSFDVAPDLVRALRKRLNLDGRKVMLFAGRLTGWKGTIQVLRALNQLVKDIPEALLLVLTAHSIDHYMQMPEFRHLDQTHVRLGGWLTGAELAAAYHTVDLALMPSICFESFGLISLEAMAASKPVICACYGALPEVVLDGETGFVVNPYDTGMFVDRMRRLLTDESLAQQMGAAGYQRLLEHFTIEQHVEQTIGVYESVLRASR